MTQAMSLPSFTIPVCSVDLKTRIIQELERHDYNTQDALQAVSKLTSDDFPHAVEWTPEEVESFEKAITLYGHDLFRVGRKVPSKKHADVVRYFKRFKKFIDNKLVVEEENDVSRMPTDDGDEEEEESDSEHDATVVHVDAQTMRSFQCANCLAIDSIRWRRMPTDIDRKRKQFRQVLCDACGEYWLKYGVMRKTAAMLDNKHALQRGGVKRGNNMIKDLPTTLPITTLQTMNGNGSMKRKRVDSGLMTKKRLMFEPIPCAVCTILEPHDPLFICYDCGMSVHRDCYGISQESKDNWVCNVCENKRSPTASYHYECILCKNPPSSAYQQPLKKTSSYNWAHVLCAICIPEIKFVDAVHLDTIEYIPAIDAWRWEKVCHLCHRQEGACVKCDECEKSVHVQCAIQNGYNVGFEIISSLDSEGVVNAGRFGNGLAQGEMVPQVCCPEHNLSHKQWIQLSARDVDGESCISVYATLYKQVEPGTTPAMRRYKALVLSSGAPYSPPYKQDPLPLTSQSDTSTSSSSPSSPPSSTLSIHNPPSSWQPTCSQCPVEISPMWWPSIDEPSSGKMLCHRCYWKHKQDVS